MEVLIIDDFLDSREITEAALISTDPTLEIRSVESAYQGFECLKVEGSADEVTSIDLILMDIDMPEINGVEACRVIKADPRLRDIPIIMVTSFDHTEYLEEAFSAGAMDYVTKPIEAIELGARVRSALNLKVEQDCRKLAYEMLERESMAKSQILSTVTHELRTPLTGIMGYVDMMLKRKETCGELTERQEQYLEYVLLDAKVLKTLIDDLLDVTKLEAGSLKLHTTELEIRPEMEHVLRTLQSQFAEKSIRIELKTPPDLPLIYTDQVRFSQILSNLISNAFKYSPDGATVSISARVNGDDLEVIVNDTGIGIAKENQEKLFTKFFRVDNSSTRDVSGSGLGLFITKLLVEAQGGRITLESEPGKGSTFSFLLPLTQADSEESN